MSAQLDDYANRLAYEIDSWDLAVALDAGENVVGIDARDRHPTHGATAQAASAACGCN